MSVDPTTFPLCSLGLDIGSTTAKLVILNPEGELLFAAYERHLSEPRTLLSQLLAEAAAKLPGLRVRGACTGSGGITLARALGLFFVQEVIASTTAVRKLIPQTSVAIELGGEDAKITFFEGNIEQRMNETCAGGTGAFIDQMASYLQTDAKGLNDLAKEHTTIYPIASRCGVFAKTDVLPLLNEGAARENIAASIFQAVVDQTVGGLACGRPIKGNVAFLGGPLFFLSELRKRFEETLNLAPEKSIFPPNAQYFVAMGAALEIAEMAENANLQGAEQSSLSLEELIANLKNLDEHSGFETEPLPPLFESEEALASFQARHSKETAPRAELEKATGPLYLGFDAGSTTIKAVLIDASGAILHTYYANNKGLPLDTAVQILREIYAMLPPEAYIAHCGATGYGAGLLKAALGLEVDEVETVAHYKAANFLRPNVSFVLDIGGQDMKCLHVKDGVLDRIMLNEACSAGCGVFIETFALSLGMNKEEFASRALGARAPVDLGSRCTVFMNSKIKQAQKEGATVEDIAAGLAYSVIRNALYKVIKVSGPEDLGPVVVAQGGSFLNDALLRAFELMLGCEVFRPDISGLMGAYGIALIAKERQKIPAQSNLIAAQELELFSHHAKTTRCRLCGNRCLLTINIFPSGKYITGNRCEKGGGNEDAPLKEQEPVNLYARKYEMLFARYRPLLREDAPRGNIGVPRVLNMFDRYPYWFTLLTALGFHVEISSPSSKELYASGIDTISSQSVCYPAKLAHGHILDLVNKDIKHIFYPCISHETQEDQNADNCYNCPVVAGYPEVLMLNMDVLQEKGVTLHCPFLNMNNEKQVHRALLAVLKNFGVSSVELDKAMQAATAEYKSFKGKLRRLGEETLLDLEQSGKLGIVLAGHPYHLDPAINHGIPELIIASGAAVLTEDSIAHLAETPRPLRVLDQWPYHSRLFKAAAAVAAHPNLELIQFNSFGCGLDAISADQVQEILESANKIHTLLKIDEGANLGGVRIRIRSLLATVQENILPQGVHTSSDSDSCLNPGETARALFEQTPPELQRPDCKTGPDKIAGGKIKPLPSLPPLYPQTRFTEEMGKTYTILVPQMSPVHFQFLEKVMRTEGYNVELLPFASQEDVEEGLRFVNNDACYPAIVVIGQLMRAVRSGRYDKDKTALLISQTGGSCRATNYVGLLRRGLEKCGLGHVPVISFNMVGLEEQHGFVVTGRMLKRVMLAALYGDMLDKLTLRTRPYEIHVGETNKLAAKWAAICKNSLATFDNRLFKRNMRDMIYDFAQIPITREIKPRVGMVGEILIKYHPDANNQTTMVIESEGGEAVPTELANFVLYCLYNDRPLGTGSLKEIIADLKSHFSIWWIERKRDIIRKILRDYPRFGHIPTIHELATACREVISLGHQGGEGWLLTAEMLEMLKTDVPNILCMQPFACLPNHITGKGVIRELSRRFPFANIAPVDYDPGASEVNQLNRIKLMMAVARQNLAAKSISSSS